MKNRFKLAMSVCLAFAFAWLCISQGMLQAASPFIVQMKPPAGMTSYTARDGSRVTIPATGPVNVTSDLVKDYTEAGFVNYITYMGTKAAVNDIVYSVSPATLTTNTAAYANRLVTVTLQDAAGNPYTFINKLFATASITIANNASAGTFALNNSYLNFVNGVATFQVQETGATIVAGQQCTATVTAQSLFGYSVAAKTCVETFN